ncbi:MAG: hypothetical protein ACRED4_06495 [Brevundimonas sp.]
MLKCPFCPEQRPSRSRLDNHVNMQHGATLAAAAETTHLGPDPSHGGLTTHRGTRENCSGPDCGPAPVEDDETPLCTCGAPVELVRYEGQTIVGHVVHGNNGCTDARLETHEPTPQERAELQATWDRVGKGLDRAGKDMAEMRAALDAVDERMRKLDAELTKPSVVRRATLNQVWDRLLDAGHLAAAREVMKMIERVVD